MCLIEIKQFGKIVPVTVKDALAGRNVLLCPCRSARVSIVIFIVTDRIDKSVFVVTERMQPAHVVKEKDKQGHGYYPWRGGLSGLHPCLFLRPLRNIEIRRDIAFEFVGQLNLVPRQKCLPAKCRKQYRKGREVLGESL